MPLGTIEIREGFDPLELSKGFSTVCIPGSKGPGIFCGKILSFNDNMTYIFTFIIMMKLCQLQFINIQLVQY